MKKYLSSILAVFCVTSILLNLGCGVQSTTLTASQTTTTTSTGTTTTTTTVGVTIVIRPNEEFSSNLVNGQFYMITDISNNFHIGTPTLKVTKNSSTSSFSLELDAANQSLVAPADSSTTPTVYKLTNKASFDSFVSSNLTPEADETLEFSLSFDASVADSCLKGRSFTNYIRIGSGSDILQFASFTYKINQSQPIGQPCGFSVTNANVAGSGSINDFLSNL